eukprot:TRINITY_DN20277_c0_g1_i1.p1 TRINITY_DN20277_c0_g1~~TRINITY_DN20277_c0_g1_i1.p1  ORF type:complete len:255 (+),score=39.75 TRINITY_DN20277_c0_g1_i1:103-765(+)
MQAARCDPAPMDCRSGGSVAVPIAPSMCSHFVSYAASSGCFASEVAPMDVVIGDDLAPLPEANSGCSDSECDHVLAPQLKRLRIGDTSADDNTNACADACGGIRVGANGFCSIAKQSCVGGGDGRGELGRGCRYMATLGAAAPFPAAAAPAWGAPPSFAPTSCIAPASPGDTSGYGTPVIPEEWRAELLQRARGEQQRFRQELRRMEMGPTLRPCSIFVG